MPPRSTAGSWRDAILNKLIWRDGRGWTLPGYNYLGPSFAPLTEQYLRDYPPTSELDRIAMQHDLDYARVQDRGLNPYGVNGATADFLMSRTIRDAIRRGDIPLREQPLAYASIALWNAKHTWIAAMKEMTDIGQPPNKRIKLDPNDLDPNAPVEEPPVPMDVVKTGLRKSKRPRDNIYYFHMDGMDTWEYMSVDPPYRFHN